MTTVSATPILASRHAITGDRLDTLLLRYPRCIHSEFMTHRMLSRNAASSRAIPVEKLIQDVLDDSFVPLVWGKNQKGMQAGEECDSLVDMGPTVGQDAELRLTRERAWLFARDTAVEAARAFNHAGYHKQIVNRLIEPFSHIVVVCSSTNWSNFLALRDHPDAEPHIQILAREIRKALDGAVVQELLPGEWHLPFVSASDAGATYDYAKHAAIEDREKMLMKLSAARCASTSYKTVDGFDMTIERAVALVDKLIGSTPLHASPFEHVAQADYVLASLGWKEYENPGQHGNFTGFRQWRKMLPNESL